MTSRAWDWVERLAAVRDAHACASFEYGRNDCALFAARCVDAITGSSCERDLAAEYSSEFGAARVITGAGSLEAAVTARLGEPIARLQAQRGDVVLLPGEGGVCLGVCFGEYCTAFRPEGLADVSIDHVLIAWRVGRG